MTADRNNRINRLNSTPDLESSCTPDDYGNSGVNRADFHSKEDYDRTLHEAGGPGPNEDVGVQGTDDYGRSLRATYEDGYEKSEATGEQEPNINSESGIREVSLETFDCPAPESRVWQVKDYDHDGSIPKKAIVEVQKMEDGKHWQQTRLDPNSVAKLYNAMSFLNYQHGLFFNTHIVLSASALGFENHREFVSLLPLFHKELSRSLFTNEKSKPSSSILLGGKRRVGKRMVNRVPHPHYWIQVVEYSRDIGLHVHILCSVPPSLKMVITEKSEDWWTMKSPGLPKERDNTNKDSETRLKGVYCGIKGKNQLWHVDQNVAKTQHRMFSYIIKSMKTAPVCLDKDGKIWSAGNIFNPYHSDCSPVIVEVTNLCGASRSLDKSAQIKAGYQSFFDDGYFDRIYSGDEMENRLRDKTTILY